MKLKRLAIQNIRSFGQKREVEFHDDFTILIGPNGGGKSNLLDVITVGVHQFFLTPWGLIRQEDASGPYWTFTSENPFGNIFGEDLVILILFSIIPFLVPVPMMFLGIITASLQAFIFVLLTMIYLGGAVASEHEQHEHGAMAAGEV